MTPRYWGITLIEMLFVIAIIAILLTTGVMYYRHQQQRLGYRQIKNDVTQIYQTLNDYYHQTGCDKHGEFAGKTNADVIDLLNLPSYFSQKNPRFNIQRYHAEITQTNIITKTKRPVYELQVSAELINTVPVKEKNWLQHTLLAEVGSTNRLVWQSLPANSRSQGDDQYWPLNGFSRIVKSHLNDTSMDSSAAYCAQ